MLSLVIAAHMWHRCRVSASQAERQGILYFDAQGQFEPGARSVGALAASGLGVGSLAACSASAEDSLSYPCSTR